MNYLSLVDAGYAVDTLFSMALQCQVKEAFSATQDKSEAMKVQAFNYCLCRRVVVHVEYYVSCLHSFTATFFSHFPIVKLSDFVSLNYLATTFFNVATVFSLKVANFEPGNYDIFPIATQEFHR